MDLIQDMFEDRNATHILSLHLFHTDNNHHFWKKEKFGLFFVKSAYVLLQKNKMLFIKAENTRF